MNRSVYPTVIKITDFAVSCLSPSLPRLSFPPHPPPALSLFLALSLSLPPSSSVSLYPFLPLRPLISLFTINSSLPISSTILANIFNLSLKTANYSLCWKRAYLRPLSKITTPSFPSDTRPIANLCEISKIFERLIHMQVAN